MSAPPAIRLATEIAAQFRHVPEEQAAETIAGHIRLFWDPRMRTQRHDLVTAAGAECDPLVARAEALLQAAP
jgi:formate dehydrogenase subunit delta